MSSFAEWCVTCLPLSCTSQQVAGEVPVAWVWEAIQPLEGEEEEAPLHEEEEGWVEQHRVQCTDEISAVHGSPFATDGCHRCRQARHGARRNRFPSSLSYRPPCHCSDHCCPRTVIDDVEDRQRRPHQ